MSIVRQTTITLTVEQGARHVTAILCTPAIFSAMATVVSAAASLVSMVQNVQDVQIGITILQTKVSLLLVIC